MIAALPQTSWIRFFMRCADHCFLNFPGVYLHFLISIIEKISGKAEYLGKEDKTVLQGDFTSDK